MTDKKLNRIIALFVFAVTMTVYGLTLAPTVVFWDVGEFIAAAKMLQVPHPPGSPLFLLTARVAMMIPFAADQAVRAHALSALFSAVSIAFFYLVIVRVVNGFRGQPASLTDRITVYGAAVIGAFSLAFGTTYWDNAIEAEVYGASMFFLSTIVWLALRWVEKDGTAGNEKHLLIIAYLIGLSLGVHLLALLAIFPVLMVVYFKRYEVTTESIAKFGLIALAAFFVVYPGIVKYLPEMMDGEFNGKRSVLFEWIPWLIILAMLYGAYTSYQKRQKVLHIALLSMSLIVLGYTTYTSVIIRANENPPMNENAPKDLAALTSYLGREQYGNAPLFLPRRYSLEPHQQGIYTNYTSDMDFLWRYQLSHMFFRYVGWNYIGQAGDAQESGVSLKDFFGVPFFVGLFGLWYLFRRDWKMGLVFLAMFVILGPVLALYQNQQEPQPRERDYFYVGAFFVFSLWISVGLVGIVDLLREAIQPEGAHRAAAVGVVAVFTAFIPARMLQVNWHEHDRSGNYVAWDYSYNILQTCEPDAILFTNGDNDTFPLWYLQDVEGVRRDVRIVNLSLVNTNWYIQQMKDPPYYKEAKAVPISLSDAAIARIQPVQWEPRELSLPVTDEALQRYHVTDSAVVANKAITFMLRNTLEYGQTKAIRIQDILVRDIIFTNQWKRPIYFAVTCAPDSKLGLDEYLWFHGLAWRLEPRKIRREDLGMDAAILRANLTDEPADFSTGPRYGYKFRRVGDPSVYFDENVTRMLLNYRSAFLRLAEYQASVQNHPDSAGVTLDRMDALIPRTKVPLGLDIAWALTNFYYRIDRKEKFNDLAPEVEQQCRAMIDAGQTNLGSYYSPYRILLELYEMQQSYAKAITLLRDLERSYPKDPGLKQRIAQLEGQLAAQGGVRPDSAH